MAEPEDRPDAARRDHERMCGRHVVAGRAARAVGAGGIGEVHDGRLCPERPRRVAEDEAARDERRVVLTVVRGVEDAEVDINGCAIGHELHRGAVAGGPRAEARRHIAGRQARELDAVRSGAGGIHGVGAVRGRRRRPLLQARTVIDRDRDARHAAIDRDSRGTRAIARHGRGGIAQTVAVEVLENRPGNGAGGLGAPLQTEEHGGAGKHGCGQPSRADTGHCEPLWGGGRLRRPNN
jgi:hypothetical protein